MPQSFIMDGQAHGDMAEDVMEHGSDPGLRRPYFDRNGNKCVTLNVGKHYDAEKGKDVFQYEKMTINEAKRRGYDSPVLNATTLRKDEWLRLDAAVLKQTRQRLRAWADLVQANSFSLDGMSVELLEHETVNDPGEAVVDMDGIASSRADAHLFQLEGLPLPITHSDFWFSERKLRISRNTGQPLSTLMAEAAGRRVAETIEKTTIGVQTGLTFGTAANYGQTPTVTGYRNHPLRNTASNTAPTTSNGETIVDEILAMRETLYNDGFYGPFMLYNSTDYDRYLDGDYYALTTSGAVAPTQTLRSRIEAIDDIRQVRRLDYMTPTAVSGTYNLLMISLGMAAVARAVIGMPVKVVQWESRGGMQKNFKVMGIMVPQIRADYAGNSGINHGSVT